MSESQASGWIIAISVVFQTVFAGLSFFYVYINYFRDEQNRKKDRDMKRLESDRKNIAAVLSQNYDNVETIHHDLKSESERLKGETFYIKVDKDKITEFDVLLYMCHPDKRKKFEQTADARKAAGERGLSSVLSDVDKIMKFFNELRLTLSTSLDKKCPDDLNEEFGKEITAMAQTIHPFVAPTSTRLKVIDLVTEYFRQPGNAQNRQSRGLNDVAIPLLQENQPDPDPPGQNGTALGNQVGSDRILSLSNAIPYIESLRYENGKIRCDIECEFSSLKTLVSSYQDLQPTITGKENEILEKIEELFGENQLDSNDIRHEISKIMFNLSQSPNPGLKSACQELNKCVKKILNASENPNLKAKELLNEHVLGSIETSINHLRKDHRWILSERDTYKKLETLREDLQTFIIKKLASPGSNNTKPNDGEQAGTSSN